MNILNMRNVNKKFVSGQDTITVLQDVNFNVYEGECIAIVAPSGSGKSTFLQIAATLDKPTSGNIWINRKNVNNMSDNEKSSIRANYLGFVYQFHNLLPDFTALENVMMPLFICGYSKSKAKSAATVILNQMGLSSRVNHKPSQLSGGEQQRVSIARALINKPKMIFADEPTGNLDPDTAKKVFDLFMKYVALYGCSLLMATHNLELAKKFKRIITIDSGKLLEISSI